MEDMVKDITIFEKAGWKREDEVTGARELYYWVDMDKKEAEELGFVFDFEIPSGFVFRVDAYPMREYLECTWHKPKGGRRVERLGSTIYKEYDYSILISRLRDKVNR